MALGLPTFDAVRQSIHRQGPANAVSSGSPASPPPSDWRRLVSAMPVKGIGRTSSIPGGMVASRGAAVKLTPACLLCPARKVCFSWVAPPELTARWTVDREHNQGN